MEIRGITVTLINKTEVGKDLFNAPIYEEREVQVENVIVSPTGTEDAATAQNLFGKKAEYTLGIPKGDTNTWEDSEVRFFGRRWRTFGFVIEGIEEMIPLSWHKKVMVERYE